MIATTLVPKERDVFLANQARSTHDHHHDLTGIVVGVTLFEPLVTRGVTIRD